MKHPISRLKQAPGLVLAGLACFLAFAIEIIVFQSSWYSQLWEHYEEVTVDISQAEGWNGDSVGLAANSLTTSFDDLDVEVRSITVTTAGPYKVIPGNIGICDEASHYSTTGAAQFEVNPGGAESTFTVEVHSRGKLSRIRITFTDEKLEEPVYITSVVLNQYQPLSIHWLRLVLMAGLLTVLFLVLRYRLYAQEYQLHSRKHLLLNLTVLGACMLVVLFIMYGSVPEHSFLKPYPTLNEVRSTANVVDAYMQQLDAFEKGQLELDLDVNPALEEMDNPYDEGERIRKDVDYHFDRAYYNGKYYSYFGLAPLFMIYYPVYMLTGMLPTELLANSILTVFAILCIFAAIQALLRLLKPRVNLLLFLVGEFALICGSFVFMNQASITFYYQPLICATGWIAAFIALSVTAYLSERRWLRILCFFLSGISIVMLVMSRPNMTLLAICFALPLFLRILLNKEYSLRRRWLESALPFLVPVLIGAAGIMYYNYIRFGSFFEFGTSYQMTVSDIRYNKVTFSIRHVAAMLYHYFLETFDYQEFFPFLKMTTDRCVNFGNYMYQEYSVSLFAMPINLGIFLLPALFSKKQPTPALQKGALKKEALLQKQLFLLLLAGILCLSYINFMLGGIHNRYVCDSALFFSLMAFLLILQNVHYDGTRSARIIYVIALAVFLVTISRGLLLIFSNEKFDMKINSPDFYLWVAKMFHF